jgi:hypothetical protein
LLIVSLVISVNAVSAVPKPVMEATESVVRVLAEYSDGYATGSGFVIKSDKEETLIATNYHVVEGNPYSISVWISAEETMSASIVAYTDQKDICILKLAYPVPLKALVFAKNGAKQGEAVYAVGFPGAADYLSDSEAHTSADATITDGIVSAVREATVSSYGTPAKILQINAAINSGNSGGPLFNADGKVVGINTYGISDAQGIFGAIDVSELKAFMADNAVSPKNADGGLWWIILVGGVIAVVVVLIVVLRKKKMRKPAKVRVKNIPLRDYMAAYPDGIGMTDAVAMLLPVALQLRDLHNEGKAHLQVSPNAVSVSAGGAVLEDATGVETDRYISGYAAPEIYKDISAGNRSDVYSFCALLFYVASGKQPANSLSREDGAENIQQEQFDEAFMELIKTGMALGIEERFGSMQELIVRLSPYNIAPFVKEDGTVRTVEVKHTKKKKWPYGLKTVVIIWSVIAVLIGINFGCYFAAKQATVKHNFAVAEKLMWFSPLTEMYDSELDDYIEAGCMMENRQFREAIVKLTKISNYSNAEELSNEVYYRWALQCADKSDFSEAVSYMTRLSEENYRDSEEKLKELKYRWSMELINKGEYLAAFAKLRLIQEYPNAKETLTALTEFVYQEGQNLYHEGKYFEAKDMFDCIPTYEDSGKYITLIKARDIYYWKLFTYEDIVGLLTDYFYFEDAAELLLSNQGIAEEFLQGAWRGDGYYFKMDSEGDISYNLPWFNYGDYYKIEDGQLLLYPENNEADTRTLFYFNAIAPNCIEVYCSKNGETYTLHRQ